MQRPTRSDLAVHWGLDPNTVFLNHGSFGATPLAVREEQRRWQDRMEFEPVAFLDGEGLEQTARTRQALAEMLLCDGNDLALVDNATTGVNTVLRSLEFNAGDELLVPDHAYQACRNALDFVAERWGAKVVTVHIPFPVSGPDEVVEAIMNAVTPRTVLAMIDTVTSPTGLRMPFETLVDRLERRGVAVLLDAAHGIGMIPLNLDELGASYTTSNCHKWLCAPKGTAFLHVRRDKQNGIHPLTISHGMSFPLGETTRFRHEFDWTGTRDLSAHCSIPTTIEHVGGLVEGGWPAIMQRNHDLVIRGRNLLCETLSLELPCPDEMVACIATLVLPFDENEVINVHEQDPLSRVLKETYGIQIPVWTWASPRGRYFRISAQLYNTEDEYRYLAWALQQALASTG
ncbi:aminotransferase class V-fold PLP-dependent enzyme [Candidatus Poseidonia sp.]|nr:aminotransferase class V-fold PLP-dependent enzyme [Poseidonia sp.]